MFDYQRVTWCTLSPNSSAEDGLIVPTSAGFFNPLISGGESIYHPLSFSLFIIRFGVFSMLVTISFDVLIHVSKNLISLGNIETILK